MRKSQWFCREHLWAEGLVLDARTGDDYLTAEHRWWIERFTRKEIAEMGAFLGDVVESAATVIAYEAHRQRR